LFFYIVFRNFRVWAVFDFCLLILLLDVGDRGKGNTSQLIITLPSQDTHRKSNLLDWTLSGTICLLLFSFFPIISVGLSHNISYWIC
jgi:hypothetical protein